MGRASGIESDVEPGSQYSIQTLHILPHRLLQTIKGAFRCRRGVSMRRDKKQVAWVDAINKIKRRVKDGPIHRVMEPRRWPQAPVDVDHERAVCQDVQVIVAARGASKNMPDPQVLIANCLKHDRPLPPPPAFLVHAAVLHRAFCPPPVATVQAPNKAGHPALCVARHDPLLVLGQARSIWPLAPPRLVFQVLVDAQKHRPRHAESPLKVRFIVRGGAAWHAIVVTPDAVHRPLKLPRLVAPLSPVRSRKWSPSRSSHSSFAVPCTENQKALAKEEGDGNVLIFVPGVVVGASLRVLHAALVVCAFSTCGSKGNTSW